MSAGDRSPLLFSEDESDAPGRTPAVDSSRELLLQYSKDQLRTARGDDARREELENGDFRLGRDLGGIFSAPS